MSIFTNILSKLGITKTAAPAAPAAPAPSVGSAVASQWAAAHPPQHPASMPMVDVMSKLEALAKASPAESNWKVSIADLLQLLGIDNSLAARKELAVELGCPADLMGGDSAKMNIWLHKTVLQKIADNGGNIPKELLD